MRRGRWVAYCIAFFILSSVFCLLTSPSLANSLSMTATVPLSSLWKEALRINSQAKIDVKNEHILYVSQDSLGIEKLPVNNQTIQLLVFKNNVLAHEEIKKTNKMGVADFVFISEKRSTYSVLVINKMDDKPFVVKNATVSL